MRGGGFTLIETLIALALVSALYAFLSVSFDARSRPAAFAASTVQARLWADTAEFDRSRGALQPGAVAAVARTPFGGAYRIAATEHAALVSFDLPFEVRGGGVFVARESGGGTLHLAPSVFAPTAPMQEKVMLYQEAVR